MIEINEHLYTKQWQTDVDELDEIFLPKSDVDKKIEYNDKHSPLGLENFWLFCRSTKDWVEYRSNFKFCPFCGKKLD